MSQARRELPIDLAPLAHLGDTVPRINTISVQDVRDALGQGIVDFREMPRHTLFLVPIYAVVCLLLIMATFDYDIVQLAFPFCAGLTLVGPFAAVGLYELSRRREQGLDTSWWHMFKVSSSGSPGSLLLLGVTLLAAFLLWLAAAHAVYALTFGDVRLSLGAFAGELFTTGHGWALIIVGNAVGAVFALVIFMLTVVSFPMLVDRRVSAWTAVKTSIAAVLANPRPMLTWGLIVAVALALGCLPIFVGLALVLPVLGHATWHLYRKVLTN